MGEGENGQRTTHERGVIFKSVIKCNMWHHFIFGFVFPLKVLAGRQQQLEQKMHQNRKAQEESLKRREELIQQLEMERELQRQEKELEEGRRTARKKEIDSQVL